MSQGRLFIVSAPSGAGKTTLLRKVVPTIERLAFSVSHTTRAPRPGEQDGISYHFTRPEHFRQMCAAGAFLEWAEVHGQLYGTSKEAVFAQLDGGVDVILDIDVQGAFSIRKSGAIAATSIFVAPPSHAELERRLRSRAHDDEQTIQLRLKNAVKEMQAMDAYDYLIVNGSLDEAARVLEAVILAERSKMRRSPSGLPFNRKLG